MTPKEKAKELVDKFYKIEPVEPIYIGMDKSQSKQCALICVDEQIKGNENYKRYINNWQESNKYWQEVKQEIEKLK